MEAGDCVNLILPRVLSSSNEVSVRFSQVIPTKRASPARCIPITCLGCQGSQIKLQVWVMVSDKPLTAAVNTQGSCSPQLLCLTSQWHILPCTHLLGKFQHPPEYPGVFLTGFSLPYTAGISAAMSVWNWPGWLMIYLLTDPSGPASLCRFQLAYPSSGLQDPKSQQHQGDTPGTVCKQITTEQDKHYQVSLNTGTAQDQYHTHRSA